MYAFGVLLWEMMSGCRAWDGLTPAQVMLAVALQQQTLSYPPNAHPDLVRHAVLSLPLTQLPLHSAVMSACGTSPAAKWWA